MIRRVFRFSEFSIRPSNFPIRTTSHRSKTCFDRRTIQEWSTWRPRRVSKANTRSASQSISHPLQSVQVSVGKSTVYVVSRDCHSKHLKRIRVKPIAFEIQINRLMLITAHTIITLTWIINVWYKWWPKDERFVSVIEIKKKKKKWYRKLWNSFMTWYFLWLKMIQSELLLLLLSLFLPKANFILSFCYIKHKLKIFHT